MIEFFEKLWYLFRHLGDDDAWRNLLQFIGQPMLYLTLFGIIFLETGVVIFPFLPGDSLLFAVGAVSARDVGIHFGFVVGLLWLAAIIGDSTNYWIGRRLGPAVFNRPDRPDGKKTLGDRLLNRKHLDKAQKFYEKHGGKTIILARFVPIIRTFAPFVAGVGKMNYARFLVYSLSGGVAWVGICTTAGYYFGQITFVKKNFELVIVAIVLISVIPVAIEFLKARKADKTGGDAILEATTLGERVE